MRDAGDLPRPAARASDSAAPDRALLGAALRRAYAVDQTACFGELLTGIDDACAADLLPGAGAE